MSNTEAIITLTLFLAFVGGSYYLVMAGLHKLSKAANKATQQKQRDLIPAMIGKVLSNIPLFPDYPLTTSDEFRVAGITFGQYATSSAGVIIGYASPEPTNRYNPNAIILKSYDNRKLGYIANDELDDYQDFAAQYATLPFICELSYFTDDTNKQKIMGRITLLKGSQPSIIQYLTNHLNATSSDLL